MSTVYPYTIHSYPPLLYPILPYPTLSCPTPSSPSLYYSVFSLSIASYPAVCCRISRVDYHTILYHSITTLYRITLCLPCLTIHTFVKPALQYNGIRRQQLVFDEQYDVRSRLRKLGNLWSSVVQKVLP